MHFFTQKPYNFHPNLPSTHISQQLNKIFVQLHSTPNNILQGAQTHSANVQVITSDNLRTFDPTDTDGLITNLRGVALTTYVADCQAVLLYDPVQQVIANLHAGWRGTLKQILAVAVHQMAQIFGSQPQDIQAYICPCIQSCCLELGQDAFQEVDVNLTDLTPYLRPTSQYNHKFYFDAVRFNCDLLKSLGLSQEHIFTSDICTKCHSDLYHSYRTDGMASGRNLACICLT